MHYHNDTFARMELYTSYGNAPCVHNGTTITSDVIHGVIRIVFFKHIWNKHLYAFGCVRRINLSRFIITSMVTEANGKSLPKIIQNLHKTSPSYHGYNIEYTVSGRTNAVCGRTNTPVNIFAKDIFIICRKHTSIATDPVGIFYHSLLSLVLCLGNIFSPAVPTPLLEDREGWKGIVATSFLVPRQPPRLRD